MGSGSRAPAWRLARVLARLALRLVESAGFGSAPFGLRSSAEPVQEGFRRRPAPVPVIKLSVGAAESDVGCQRAGVRRTRLQPIREWGDEESRINGVRFPHLRGDGDPSKRTED